MAKCNQLTSLSFKGFNMRIQVFTITHTHIVTIYGE